MNDVYVASCFGECSALYWCLIYTLYKSVRCLEWCFCIALFAFHSQIMEDNKNNPLVLLVF